MSRNSSLLTKGVMQRRHKGKERSICYGSWPLNRYLSTQWIAFLADHMNSGYSEPSGDKYVLYVRVLAKMCNSRWIPLSEHDSQALLPLNAVPLFSATQTPIGFNARLISEGSSARLGGLGNRGF